MGQFVINGQQCVRLQSTSWGCLKALLRHLYWIQGHWNDRCLLQMQAVKALGRVATRRQPALLNALRADEQLGSQIFCTGKVGTSSSTSY
jgi:hypothetical protein